MRMKIYLSVLKLFIALALLLCFLPVLAQGRAQTSFDWNVFIFLIIFSLIILLMFIVVSVKIKEMIYKSRKRKIDRRKKGRISRRAFKRLHNMADYN